MEKLRSRESSSSGSSSSGSSGSSGSESSSGPSSPASPGSGAPTAGSSSRSSAAGGGRAAGGNAFANDGSFMELFKKKMEDERRRKELEEAGNGQATEDKKPVSMASFVRGFLAVCLTQTHTLKSHITSHQCVIASVRNHLNHYNSSFCGDDKSHVR